MSKSARSLQMPARLRNLGPRERALAIILGIIVVLVILFLLLSGGGGGPTTITTPPVVRRPSPTPSATTTTPPETSQSFEGKDPFQPLVVVAAPGSSGTPTPTPTGSITGVNGGGNTNPATTVTLIDINKQGGKLVATVDVDGKDFTAGVGQTFDENFRVISLSSACGTFVFGDERFSLCIGQEVRK
jgi:hypothetical protein